MHIHNSIRYGSIQNYRQLNMQYWYVILSHLCTQVRSSQQPCVVFGPDGYEHIYNDTLAKNMISDDQEGESGKINKLLHRMLDDAGQVLDLIIFTLS